MIGIDTNVLVYSFDMDDLPKRVVCKRLLDGIFDGQQRGVVTVQILAEFASVMTRKVRSPLSRASVAEFIRAIIASDYWTVFPYEQKDIISALGSDRPFWDALIASTLLRNSVRTFVTYNAKDFAGSGLTVRSPL